MLKYDLSRVQNLDTSDQGWEVTRSILVGSMLTHVGAISENNYRDWYGRYALLFPEARDERVTLASVRAHVGLVADVPNLSRRRWVKKMIPRQICLAIGAAERAESPQPAA